LKKIGLLKKDHLMKMETYSLASIVKIDIVLMKIDWCLDKW